MYRSEINKLIDKSITFAEHVGFVLPPFAKWTVDDWKSKGSDGEHINIYKSGLGWDVSDYGFGEFLKTGIIALTIRNGIEKIYKHEKTYAEKLLFLEPNQNVPIHFHPFKIEDLINRSGDVFYIKLYNVNEDNSIDMESPVPTFMDGRTFTVNPGEIITVKPGESITLMPRQYHQFWTEKEKTLFGEVTMTDNTHHFYNCKPSETKIIEDVPLKYLLTSDYSVHVM